MSSTVTSTGTTLTLQYTDPNSKVHNLPHPLLQQLLPFTRSFSAKGVIAAPDLSPASGSDLYNDGAGVGFRDTDIMFNGRPSFRMCPQQTTIGLSSPGRTANTSGCVTKIRRVNLVGTAGIPSNVFGWEQWIRWTSNNNNAAVFTTASVYDRDGTNVFIGRLWVDTTLDPMILKILQNGGNYLQIGSYNTSVAQGTYQPETGIADRAGSWNYVKLVVDMYNKVYVSVQFNEVFVDLSAAGPFGLQTLDSTPDTGSRVLHFSTEFSQTNSLSTERFINMAQPVATFE